MKDEHSFWKEKTREFFVNSRYDLRLKQNEMARKLGILQSNLSNYETGRVMPPAYLVLMIRELKKRMAKTIKDIVADTIGSNYESIVAGGIEKYEREYITGRRLSETEIRDLSNKGKIFFDGNQALFDSEKLSTGAKRDIMKMHLAGEDVSFFMNSAKQLNGEEDNSYQ